MSSAHSQKAAAYFRQGYNCAQAVALAFRDQLQMDEKRLAMAASSFGGGMGRLREVCGAVSGMFLVYGMMQGYHEPDDYEGKKMQYQKVQKMAKAFEERHGSIVCRDLLKKPAGPEDAAPEIRTNTYYQERPCERCVADAAEILEKFLRK